MQVQWAHFVHILVAFDIAGMWAISYVKSFNFLNQPGLSNCTFYSSLKTVTSFPDHLLGTFSSRPTLQLPACPATLDLTLAAGGSVPMLLFLDSLSLQGVRGFPCLSRMSSNKTCAAGDELQDSCRRLGVVPGVLILAT